MLEEIHKFASEASRPIAMNDTRKRTHKSINGVVQPEWAQNVEATENARLAQLNRDASMIAQ